jgi:hypothetical protein
MINIICAVHRPLPIRSASQCTWWSLDPMLRCITGLTLFLFQFRIQIPTHSWVKLSCYRVLIWAHHPWCRGEGLSQPNSLRCGHHCRLQLDTRRRRRGHLQLEGKPPVENASMDKTDAATSAIFFFATDGKSFVPTFNCSIRNTSKCRMSRLLIHLCLQVFFFIGRTWLHQRGPKHGRIRQGRGRWHWQQRGTVIELYILLCFCVKTMRIFVWRLCIVVWRLWIFIDLYLVV